MADQIFENIRLVSIYDEFDKPRIDLDHYISIIKEVSAKSILDIGCGTGCLALRLIEQGIAVTGLDPAKASLDFAQSKPNADQIKWILGDVTNLNPLGIDVAVMTGNVAQVFLTDQSWEEALAGIRRAIRPKGYLVFEVRNPAAKAWIDWTRDKTYRKLDIPKVGIVESWCEVIDVVNELVSFQWNYIFQSDGQIIKSISTLRFREQRAIEQSLKQSGYNICEIREAPDRPGKEFVFITTIA